MELDKSTLLQFFEWTLEHVKRDSEGYVKGTVPRTQLNRSLASALSWGTQLEDIDRQEAEKQERGEHLEA